MIFWAVPPLQFDDIPLAAACERTLNRLLNFDTEIFWQCQYKICLIPMLFVVSGNMTPDRRMKRISAPSLIRCHISEPQNPTEPRIFRSFRSADGGLRFTQPAVNNRPCGFR